MPLEQTDVVIIGGSYAGLSAAMALGRSLRNVIVIDGGFPCNRQTPHSHNFLTQDGETPAAIRQKAIDQVRRYGTISLLDGLVTGARKTDHGFVITTSDGREVAAKKLVLATGIKDRLPDIKGFAECWGRTIVHCPYCHGYEIRGRNTGILANGPRALHLSSLVSNLTDHVTVLSNGKITLDAQQVMQLERHRIRIIEKRVIEIIQEDGNIGAVVFDDGDTIALDALYADVPFSQHSSIAESLGCEMTEHGHIKVDNFQKTTASGVYACGDNSAMMRSVANAVYTGNVTGAMVNKDLVDEEF